ncbi:alpha,alpha-trehalose-phosphate synthase (UDP-forming) [Telmatospirillum siberiense]|uniref:Trehalose-6-phosphate synthase n=1 Tax=Telmatospirillum siberiense TaxID=382514 RepID=A0A2N3PQW6_9PROT|nr:trehalose-6-phosphate synthase [Telmatospirillum siberiense]PKU22795.1 trehalose-6-phosphate synthase [Telmatospirillum siberiense]
MRMTLRFALPLLLILGGITWAASPLMANLVDRWFRGDVESHAQLLFDSLKDSLTGDLTEDQIATLISRINGDKHLLALGLCTPEGQLTRRSAGWPPPLGCPATPPDRGRAFTKGRLKSGPILTSAFALPSQGPTSGYLVFVHDLRFIDDRSRWAEAYTVGLFALLATVAVAVAVLITRLTMRGWVKAVREGLANTADARLPPSPEIASLVGDVQKMLRDGEGQREPSEMIRVDWTADSLKHLLKTELPDAEVIVVSNREPYIHNDVDGEIRIQRPASGLVTALEPITRACGGIWIAHGSGSADRRSVDEKDHVAVPPDAPSYVLRRIWLTDEEVEGYYFGLANEGLWPLCHIAFIRPAFRAADWQHYVAVNRKFADAIVAEAKSPNPLVLVQDYHFALVPKMVRESLPDATIITFWHIPWPNPEMFSICPWREEILSGLLSSSILGFHTQFHCINFLDSVDRFLECHIDREHSTVTTGASTTLIRPYPISIEWPAAALAGQPDIAGCRKAVYAKFNLSEDIRLAIGVERFDYTKGIPDRFRAVESLLENHPEWIGRFCLLQIAAPSRAQLAAYQAVQVEAQDVARAINDRFGRDGWQPIILIARHHDAAEICTLFRAADLCVVTSLHDGMNLVAKEFVAARDDDDGVLILSTFAGASRELLEALIVNPYDIRGMGEAIHQGLSMSSDQRRDRMRLMREMVAEYNIYFWAGRMLMDAARIRKRQGIEKPLDNGEPI